MKHEYLIELLKLNKTVILPNIGAFSNNTNPQHPFLFNEFLKFNDGMIAKHISSKEGISMDAAGETIDKFTGELKDILTAGKEVVIPGIGTLHKKDGKTILTHGSTSVSSTPIDEKKPEPVVEKKTEPVIEKKPEPVIEKPAIVITPEVKKIDPVIEKKPEPVIEKKIEPVVEKKPEPIVVKKPEPIIEKKSEPVIEKKPEPVIEKKIEPIAEKKPEPVIEKKPEDKKTEPAIPVKAETPKTKKEKPKKEKAPRKKRRLVWILLILLILGGGGTAGFLYKDDLMKMMGMGAEEKTAEKKSGDGDKKDSDKNSDTENTSSENNVTEEPIVDTAVADVAPVEEVVEEPKEEIKVEQVVEENKTAPLTAENSNPGNYYIIVGCFQESSNAENMMAKISAAGMSPTNVGTFNSLSHIAAGSASDLPSAIQQANTIRGTFAKAWILKR